MDKVYKPKPREIAGFQIIGHRRPDGHLNLGHREYSEGVTISAKFPQYVELNGMIYTLERVILNKELANLEPNHPGYNIEWGEYV